MSRYQIALNWNNEGSLADLLVQPATPGRLQVSRDYSADGKSAPYGTLYADLVYTILTNDEFPALNSQMGISLLVPDSAVTIRLKQDNDEFANFNGWIHYPESPQHSMAGWKVTYRVTIIEAL